MWKGWGICSPSFLRTQANCFACEVHPEEFPMRRTIVFKYELRWTPAFAGETVAAHQLFGKVEEDFGLRHLVRKRLSVLKMDSYSNRE